jgi:hypothetical protein
VFGSRAYCDGMALSDSKRGIAPLYIWQSKQSRSIFLFDSSVKTLSYVWYHIIIIIYISNIIILNITIYITFGTMRYCQILNKLYIYIYITRPRGHRLAERSGPAVFLEPRDPTSR